MVKLFNFFIFAFVLHPTKLARVLDNNVQYLEHGERIIANPRYTGLELQTYCYKGRKKYIIYTWQSVIFQLNHTGDDYTLYHGNSPEEVQNEYSKNQFYWTPNIFMVKQKSFKVNPFNTTCIGIKSLNSYSVQFTVINIDFWKILFLGIGIGLFLLAETLSENTLFHFASGIIFGICASALVFLYLLSKIFLRRPLMYGVMGMGWTIVIYIWHLIWDNIQLIATDYKLYVFWYIIITGFFSFIVCYRWGPVENQRTKNLIKWALQFIALCLIYNSSNYQEAAMAQVVILLLSYNIPQSWKMAPKTYWAKKFPPKVCLLTNEEFYQEGVVETAKSLQALREYCSSPECNQWKTVLKLKDVKRFASFMEGNSHLSDEEILEYETFLHDLTDEENNELTDEELTM